MDVVTKQLQSALRELVPECLADGKLPPPSKRRRISGDLASALGQAASFEASLSESDLIAAIHAILPDALQRAVNALLPTVLQSQPEIKELLAELSKTSQSQRDLMQVATSTQTGFDALAVSFQTLRSEVLAGDRLQPQSTPGQSPTPTKETMEAVKQQVLTLQAQLERSEAYTREREEKLSARILSLQAQPLPSRAQPSMLSGGFPFGTPLPVPLVLSAPPTLPFQSAAHAPASGRSQTAPVASSPAAAPTAAAQLTVFTNDLCCRPAADALATSLSQDPPVAIQCAPSVRPASPSITPPWQNGTLTRSGATAADSGLTQTGTALTAPVQPDGNHFDFATEFNSAPRGVYEGGWGWEPSLPPEPPAARPPPPVATTAIVAIQPAAELAPPAPNPATAVAPGMAAGALFSEQQKVPQ
ncbi:hypothetical protein WJX73_007425 [Symbiochloris irregularis]|uniref:Uncharacterized protein n=1 Tax=Symbiochloris irregularis TaxID=706552 RepID=A0AAW1NTX2_9CHLO